MASVKDLNRRISSLRNMQKVMRAMNMIATVKLRKLFALQEPLKRFREARDAVVANLASGLRAIHHPAATGYDRVRTARIVMFTADKGLCGSHNTSVQRAADRLYESLKRDGVEAQFTCIGTKGAGYCTRKGLNVTDRSEINERVFGATEIRKLAADLAVRFRNADVQRVVMIYNRFVSTLHQETITVDLMPFVQTSSRDAQPSSQFPSTTSASESADFDSEPPLDELADSAVELTVAYALQDALSNSMLSEQAARMTAMENATNNSEDLINRYTTMQNRARQDAITREIIEIISGKEAMEE